VPHLAPIIRTCIGVKPDEFANMAANWKSFFSYPQTASLQFSTVPEAMELMTVSSPANPRDK